MTAFPVNLGRQSLEKLSRKTFNGGVFFVTKIKKCTSTDVFLRVFSDFSGQLSASSEQPLRRTKNVPTAFPDNLRSSRQVFFEIADLKYLRKIPGNHPL